MYIPASAEAAERHLRIALSGRLRAMAKREFLRAYCSLAYTYPGFHPDCIGDWDGPREVLRIAREALRRAGAGQLTDNELDPCQATKAAIVCAGREAGIER
jgi:hypothetical protein